jgi:protein TonB
LSSLTAPSIRSQPSLVKVNISQGVSQGLLIKRVQPRYPQSALAMHLQGAVQLGAMIDKEGKIVNLQVLKGDAMLARAAMDAVRQWRYKPYYLDGVPVDIETQITVNFRLPN